MSPWLHFANSLLHVWNKAGSTQRHPLIPQSHRTAILHSEPRLQFKTRICLRKRTFIWTSRLQRCVNAFVLNKQSLVIFNLYGKILLSGWFSLPKCVSHRVLTSIWNDHPYPFHTLDQFYAFCRWKRLIFTMKTSVLMAFSFVLPLISAQVPHWGPCPEPAVQPGFSLKQVQGLCQHVGCHSRTPLPLQ